MTNKKRMLIPSVLAITALAAGPAAALTATATTDLNLRAGPGPAFEITSVIDADGEVDLAGCTETGEWCQVTYDGTQGWAYSAYLTAPLESEEPVVLYENTTEVTVVEYEGDAAADATAGTAFGAAAGSLLVGGPAAVAAGALVGAATGAFTAEPDTVVTYIESNPVEPVYLNGEVAVGAGIPEDVELYEVPETEYVYLNVNEMPVVVNPDNRRIVYVVR